MGMKILWNRSIGDNKHYRQLTQTMDYTIIEDGADCYPWTETFVIWPRRSVTGQPLFWTKAYKRRVWIMWGTGFHMEPQTEYATVFDLLVYNPKVMGRE
jgi:hypothetical protein